jgi:hypothetical protein
VRERLAEMGVDAVIVDGCEDLGDRWRVDLRAGGRTLAATVELTESAVSSPPSCGKDPEPISGYALVDLT